MSHGVVTGNRRPSQCRDTGGMGDSSCTTEQLHWARTRVGGNQVGERVGNRNSWQ